MGRAVWVAPGSGLARRPDKEKMTGLLGLLNPFVLQGKLLGNISKNMLLY